METRTNTWNAAIENTVKFIGESAQAYKMMHLLSAKQFSLLNNTLMYISLVLSPATGTLAAITAALGNPSVYINIVIAILAFIVAIITGIIKFGSFNEKSEAHKIATSKYTSLESNVRRQLQLYRDDRIPAHEYYEWLAQSFDDLFHGAPFINDHIYEKYYKLSLEKGLVFPNRYDNFITIERGLRDKLVADIKNDGDIQVTAQESPPDSPHKQNVVLDMPLDCNDSNTEQNVNNLSQSPAQVQFNCGDASYSSSQDTPPHSSRINRIELEGEVTSNRPLNFNIYPRRRSVNTPLADLNRYGESQMNYELRRFMNF
jgi:hypothetical protein